MIKKDLTFYLASGFKIGLVNTNIKRHYKMSINVKSIYNFKL